MQGASGQLTATNNGASPSYPQLRVDGPVANPSIEQTNVGASLQFTGTLMAGDYLTIDTRTRAVVLNGSTPRRDWLAGGAVWPLLIPGDNGFVFRGTALPGSPLQASLLTVTWRDASL
jgi:glucose-6-phosphate dehydrogenase assembly protein OpcA